MFPDWHQTPDRQPNRPLSIDVQVLDGVAAEPAAAAAAAESAAAVDEEGGRGAGAFAAAALNPADLCKRQRI